VAGTRCEGTGCWVVAGAVVVAAGAGAVVVAAGAGAVVVAAGAGAVVLAAGRCRTAFDRSDFKLTASLDLVAAEANSMARPLSARARLTARTTATLRWRRTASRGLPGNMLILRRSGIYWKGVFRILNY